MYRKAIAVFLVSLGLMLLISAGVGFLAMAFGLGFFPAAFATLFFLVIYGSIMGTLHQGNQIKLAQLQETATAHQTVILACSFCKERNSVPILLNSVNTFTCRKCEKDNSVYLKFIVTRVTDMSAMIKAEQALEQKARELADPQIISVTAVNPA